jgi:hypothetical protein
MPLTYVLRILFSLIMIWSRLTMLNLGQKHRQ